MNWTKKLYQELLNWIDELGYQSGFIRMSSLYETTIEDCKNAYLTFKTTQ